MRLRANFYVLIKNKSEKLYPMSIIPTTLNADFTNVTVFLGLIKRISFNQILKVNTFSESTFFVDYDRIIISALLSGVDSVRSRGRWVYFAISPRLRFF